jgi:hypothetical protein
MSSIPFPIQLKRQFARPLDPDTVFDTVTEMNNYLSSGVRYAGMSATCKEIEGGFFILSNDRASWINIAKPGVKIVMATGLSSYIEPSQHGLGANIQVSFFEFDSDLSKLTPINIYYEIDLTGRIYWKSERYLNDGRAIIK